MKNKPTVFPKLTVIAEGKDEWGRRYLLLGKNGEAIKGVPPICVGRLHSNLADVYADLANVGINLFTASAKRDFTDALQKWGHQKSTFRVATKLGWSGSDYVLPNVTIGNAKDVYPVLGELGADQLHKYRLRKNSSLDAWNRKIGKYCPGNSRLMFAVSLAFTGPILRFVQEPRGGGFQIYGPAESGKSTAAMVAGSVWGCHGQSDNGFLEGWTTTANAIEPTALAHNDGFLPIDETKTAGEDDRSRFKVITIVIYRLAEQREKRRLKGTLISRNWRHYFLSTSNFSLWELAARANGHVDAADLGRLVDIPLPDSKYGIHEDLHGFPNGRDLTDYLKTQCRAHYGRPIREFIRKLARQDLSKIRRYLADRRKEYLQELEGAPKSCRPLQRASARFATVYAAGCLAISFKVLDWDQDELRRAILSCQLDGLRAQPNQVEDRSVATEDRSVATLGAKLLQYIRENWASFVDLRKGYLNPKTHNFDSALGYIANHRDQEWVYLSAKTLKSIIGSGAVATRFKQHWLDKKRLDKSSGGQGGRRFVVERRIFKGKGKHGLRYVHAIRRPPKTPS